MKIAVVTTDGVKINQHFGRAPYYSIFTIEDKKITNTEMRERKTGHFAKNQEQHEHNHDHNNPKGHGYAAGDGDKHDAMAQEISDCQILIAGGMGRGAYERFFSNGINVIMTDGINIQETIQLYIDGKLQNLYQQRTH